jgi:hypothetical protein
MHGSTVSFTDGFVLTGGMVIGGYTSVRRS